MVIDSGRENLAYHVQVPDQEAEKPKPRQLPVTLLSGFLVRFVQRLLMSEKLLTLRQGSGKTTLLKHILGSPDHGMRIAVIVNDMSQ
jgi:hypothetical protein